VVGKAGVKYPEGRTVGENPSSLSLAAGQQPIAETPEQEARMGSLRRQAGAVERPVQDKALPELPRRESSVGVVL
jgi:hypothetical protein